jgi:Fe-S cluster assembly protein SufD
VGDNAFARVILHQIHQDATAENMTNFVTAITIGDNSSVEVYFVQNLKSASIQLNHTEAVIGASSTLTTHTVNWGSRLTRNSLNIRLDGEGSEAHLYGLYNLNAHHHLDNRTVVDHAVPNCMSNERYKGILDDHATSVFNGKIIVRPDAQKTNAFQSNPNILLSNDATINSKPQLEIFADDVKCTHGATVGHLDEDAMFYLRSRGLGHNDARHLLIQAFAEEVIAKISIEPLRLFLSNQLHAELQIP